MSPQSNTTPWPWSQDRWQKRKEGIEKVIDETIALAEKTVEFREEALNIKLEANTTASNEGEYSLGISNEYIILNEAYQGEIAERVFQLDNETVRLKQCISLLESLKTNVLPLFDQFEKHFIEGNKKLSRFSVDFVFRAFLDQISVDLNLIQQALQQRQLSEQYEITHQGFVLQVAQVLAMNAVQPALDPNLGFTDDTNIITYLQNGINIRLIPYQNVMLIGVPYGAMNSDCDWLATDYLAIPHEVGHYLYWFKRDNNSESAREYLIKKLWEIDEINDGLKTIRSQKKMGIAPEFGALQKYQWYFQWLEEIFADGYGCRIAGPITVLSFQELLASGSPGAREHHDHKHPIPALRPLIQTRLLLDMNLIEPYQAEQLDKNWDNWVQTHWKNWLKADSVLSQEYEIEGQDSRLTGQEILDQLEPVINIVGNYLKRLIPKIRFTNWTERWGSDDLTSLYKTFAEGNFLNELQPIRDFTETSPVGRALTRQKNRFEVAGEIVQDGDQLPDDWVELMLFDTWSKEGPTSGHVGLG